MKTLKDKIKDLTYYNEKNRLKEILSEVDEKLLEVEEKTSEIIPIVPITQTNYDLLTQPITDNKLYVIIPE